VDDLGDERCRRRRAVLTQELDEAFFAELLVVASGVSTTPSVNITSVSLHFRRTSRVSQLQRSKSPITGAVGGRRSIDPSDASSTGGGCPQFTYRRAVRCSS
jgi:hypothetical protein